MQESLDIQRQPLDFLPRWGQASTAPASRPFAASYGLTLSDPRDAQEAAWMDTAIKASDADRDAYCATLSADDLAKFDAMRPPMVDEEELDQVIKTN